MKIIRQASLVAWTVLLLISPFAVAGDAGSSGFTFLKVSWGARQAGMGEMGTALASGLYGAYYNPASLAVVDNTTVGFMHQEYIFDIRREFIAAALPLYKGGLAFGLDYFKVSDIEYRESATAQPTGLFDSQDVLLFVAYGIGIGSDISLGVTGKYAAEKIESLTADVLMFDCGAAWQLNRHLTVGGALKNVGGKPRFRNEKITLPLTVAFGTALQFDKTTLGVDLVFPNDTDMRINLGAERFLADLLALRAGYKFGYDEENFTLGLGIYKNIWQVDYAFAPYSSGLGSSHRFALTIHWK